MKSTLIEKWITSQPDEIARLGNAGRLLSSWVDGVLEYTILKHEVKHLKVKNKLVLDKI